MRREAGFTLIEFLVVVGIIAILLALLIPAVGRGREAARRISCINNLKQIGLAVQSYHASHEVYPSGSVGALGPVASLPDGPWMSWTTSLLPFMEQRAVFNMINFDLGSAAIENQTARMVRMTSLNCPAAAPEESGWVASWDDGASLRRVGTSTYAGVHHDIEAPIDVDNRGVLFLNSRVAAADVSDGLSQTLFFGEVPYPSNLGWMSGTRSALRNTGHPINQGESSAVEVSPEFVGGFGSNHLGGSIFAFGDGSARYLRETIDPFILRCLGNRADGEAIDDSEY